MQTVHEELKAKHMALQTEVKELKVKLKHIKNLVGTQNNLLDIITGKDLLKKIDDEIGYLY